MEYEMEYAINMLYCCGELDPVLCIEAVRTQGERTHMCDHHASARITPGKESAE